MWQAGFLTATVHGPDLNSRGVYLHVQRVDPDPLCIVSVDGQQEPLTPLPWYKPMRFISPATAVHNHSDAIHIDTNLCLTPCLTNLGGVDCFTKNKSTGYSPGWTLVC